MGRPTPSDKNTQIAACIAQAATRRTDNKLDLVARSGHFSIFAAAKEVYPPCARSEASRDGVSEAHLNKTLQKEGYHRVRDRRAHVSKRTEDPTGAGMYLFCNLQWRDPANAEDREAMVSGWNSLLDKYPKISRRCTLGRFLEVVERFRKQWQPNAERMHGRSRFDVEDDFCSEDDGASNASNTAQEAEGTQSAHSAPPQQETAAQSLNNVISKLQLQLATQTLALLQAQTVRNAASACTPKIKITTQLPSAAAQSFPMSLLTPSSSLPVPGVGNFGTPALGCVASSSAPSSLPSSAPLPSIAAGMVSAQPQTPGACPLWGSQQGLPLQGLSNMDLKQCEIACKDLNLDVSTRLRPL